VIIQNALHDAVVVDAQMRRRWFGRILKKFRNLFGRVSFFPALPLSG